MLPVFRFSVQTYFRQDLIMAKKNKKASKNEAHVELKTLESKWLKDHRVEELEPIQVKVLAAKVAALVDFIEQNEMPVDVSSWPLAGAEDLVKFEEDVFKQGLTNLQKVGVLNSSYKFKKAEPVEVAAPESFSPDYEGPLFYRCMKPGGLMLNDRDQYIAEDEEVCYTEEAIAEAPVLQTAIANEWLVRVEKKQEQV
ncbi:MAG TPA: hypothetical protein VKX17_06005 [Planctomycetota bacterium]|nr:hypothetical protein [Planctomycetota bacterium]